MAVAIQTKNSTTNSTASTTCVITKPASLAVGDLMFAHIGSFATTTITDPGGWTQIDQVNGSGAATISCATFWKIADASDVAATNFSFGIGSSAQNGGGIFRITGHDPTTPISGHNMAAKTFSTDPTGTAFTPAANCLLLLGGSTEETPTISAWAVGVSSPTFTNEWNLSYSNGKTNIASGSRPESTDMSTYTFHMASNPRTIILLVAIQPPVPTPTQTAHNLSLLGVGS